MRHDSQLRDGSRHTFLRRCLSRNPHWKYIAPAMIVLFALSIAPTLFLLGVSLTNYQLGWKLSRAKFVGFANYTRLFTGRDPDFCMPC